MKLPNWTPADADRTGNFLAEMTHERNLAMDIVGEIFEDYLYRINVCIPNLDDSDIPDKAAARKDEGLAMIYGDVYDRLVDQTEEAIRSYLDTVCFHRLAQPGNCCVDSDVMGV